MLTQFEAQVFNKEAFLKGLGNLKQDTLHRLEVCVKNREDAERYLELVKKEEIKWKGLTAKAFASMALRQEQIKKNPITFEDFEVYYQVDPVDALQILFWDKVTQADVDKLMPKWFEKRTLRDMYDKHVKSPYDNFFNFAL